jgi:casein kinase II subunit beta
MWIFSEVIERANRIPKRPSSSFLPRPKDGNVPPSDWIQDYTEANPWLGVVDETYISDNFNLFGLESVVDNYQTVLKFLKGRWYAYEEGSHRSLDQQAKALYAYIHARYILTYNGAKEIQLKYSKKVYGTCPRVFCNGQPLLPIGFSVFYGESTAKTYCPCCQDIYETEVVIDSACFGPYFPHFFVQVLKGEVKVERKVSTDFCIMGIPINSDSPLNRSRIVH